MKALCTTRYARLYFRSRDDMIPENYPCFWSS